jgi:hypothetical protein
MKRSQGKRSGSSTDISFDLNAISTSGCATIRYRRRKTGNCTHALRTSVHLFICSPRCFSSIWTELSLVSKVDLKIFEEVPYIVSRKEKAAFGSPAPPPSASLGEFVDGRLGEKQDHFKIPHFLDRLHNRESIFMVEIQGSETSMQSQIHIGWISARLRIWSLAA